MRFLTGALAVLLVLVAYAFPLNLPHLPSVALGLAYGARTLVAERTAHTMGALACARTDPGARKRQSSRVRGTA